MKMNLSSGSKKFLALIGVLLFLGGIGNITAPKTVVKGTQAVVAPTAEIVATNTPAPTATPFPTQAPTPTRKYVAPTANPIQTKSAGSSAVTGSSDTYVNSQGNTVQSPVHSNTVPAGASAQCGDGTYSFSQSRRGTCSRHGGVAQWL